MNHLQVMKFGGTSVGDAQCIRRAAEIVLAAARESAVVVVVSAMSGVTNRLVAAARKAVEGQDDLSSEIDSLCQQHIDAVKVLVTDKSRCENLIAELKRITSETASLCRGISLLRELTPRTYATVSSVGERLSARLMAAALREVGLNSAVVESTDVVVTDDEYLQAEPLMRDVR